MTSRTWRSLARRQVERLPILAATYRQIRDDWQFRTSRPMPTPFGFDLVGNAAMARGEFEPVEREFIERRLATSDAFVDVGANVGFYTCLAAKRVRRVVAVEPLRENLDYLYANLQNNGLGNVEVFPLGLAGAPGLAPIYGGSTGASLLEGWAGTGSAYRTTIPLSTLDTVLGSRFDGERLLVKVDVEGAELGVLDGAAHVLALRPRPTWLVEVCLDQHHPGGLNRKYVETFERFWRAGYRSFSVGGTRREVLRADVERWAREGHSEAGHNYEFAEG